MTKQRTYNRRRLHAIRKKDNWSQTIVDVVYGDFHIGSAKVFMHELRMFKPKRWTDDQVDALKRPIVFTADFVWEV